jgi:hypothetical protein
MDSEILISGGLYLAFFLFLGAVGSAVVLPLIHIVKNPKSLARSGMGVGLLLVVFIIAYALSGAELTPKYEALGVTTEFSSKLIGAGLTMFYLIFVVAIIAMIYSEISKAFK